MLVRLLLNSIVAAAGAFSLNACGTTHAKAPEPDHLARYRTRADIHGLYEIREAARTFLKEENAKRKHEFSAMAPDIRQQVPRCVVPLTARWARKTIYYDQPGIDVICRKSVDKRPGNYSWDVFVPLYSPQIAEEGRRKREAAERAKAEQQ